MIRTMRLVVSALTLAALALAGAIPPASASPAPRPPMAIPYVALGDSYSSGMGTFVGDPSTGCPRSAAAHPRLLGVADAAFLACPGATASPTDPVLGAELAALQAIGADATQVTLTIGGGDLGFTEVLTACVNNPGCRNHTAVKARVAAGFNGLVSRIGRLLEAIHERAPHATILLAGYPQLFGSFRGPQCVVTMPGGVNVGPLAVERRDAGWLNKVAHKLNDRLRVAVMSVKRHGIKARFVSVEGAFRGHGLCDFREPWVNGVAIASASPTMVPFPQSFHLNLLGEQAYARQYVLRGFLPLT